MGTFGESSVYLFMALVATGLFVIRLILMLMGAGHDGDIVSGDVDLHAEAHVGDATDAFSLLSVQSVLAFFMGAGWMGLTALRSWELGSAVSALLAAVFGFAMMLLSALMMFGVRKLNQSGTTNPQHCVGAIGRVYLTVPARGQGEGQVEVTVDGRKRIIRALSNEDAPIPAFSQVTVVEVDQNNTLLVKPVG